jgi:hypothetical protein
LDEAMIVIMDSDRFNDPVRLLACKYRIFNTNSFWLEQFCQCGGVSVLVENMDNRLENKDLDEVDAAALYQLLLCLYVPNPSFLLSSSWIIFGSGNASS